MKIKEKSAAKIILAIFIIALMLTSAPAQTVFAAGGGVKFNFDANWTSMLDGDPECSQCECGYDAAEGAIKIVSDSGSTGAITADFYLNAGSAYQFKDGGSWSVVCMKRVLSSSVSQVDGSHFQILTQDSDNNVWTHVNIYKADETHFGEYGIYVKQFEFLQSYGDPAISAFKDDEVLDFVRFQPFGWNGDEAGGSVCYIKWMAFFGSESEARDFASAMESGSMQLAPNPPPTEKPTPAPTTTEALTTAEVSSVTGAPAADSTGAAATAAASGEDTGSGGYLIYIIIGAVVLVGIIVAVIIAVNSKNNKNKKKGGEPPKK